MKLLVLDGNSIVNRAFYGIRQLNTKNGFPTNAIYGFLTMFQKLKDDTEPDAVAIAFDLKAPTFRHKKYHEYKGNRKGMPDELAQQMPVLKELLGYLGYRIVECEGYEADDILGTLAQACQDTNNECIIATGDRDSLQLVDDNVTVRLMTTKMGKPLVTVYNRQEVINKYGVNPAQLIDIKAIQGDASDNIPGVKGIGVKGATDLISKYDSLNNIYQNIDNIDVSNTIKAKLKTGEESARMSYYLGTILKDIDIDTNINNYVRKEIDNKNTIRIMTQLELFSLLEKMNLQYGRTEKESTIKKDSLVISDKNAFNNVSAKLKEAYFLYEYADEKIQAIAFEDNNIVYLINNEDLISDFLNLPINFKTHDSKRIYALGYNNINIVFDTMLAAYLLNPSSSDYTINRLKEEYNYTSKVEVNDENYIELLENTAILKPLCDKLEKKIISNNQQKLLQEVELPLAKVLASMEQEGFFVDKQGIIDYENKIYENTKIIENKIYEIAQHQFNINSPKQLGVVLFEELLLPHGKKTKTGYSTSASVLEKLRYDYPIVEEVLEYRKLSKLKSTYCDGLLKVIKEDGRIHTSFNQTETRTGRISSVEPNLQNIPVRTEIGKELRRFFVAKENCVLIDADYSQIELRVLAHISKDEIMIDAFNNNDDIHAITASQVFHMPLSMVTPLMRTRAKAVNFGIVYGIGAFSLSKSLDISVKEATDYIKNYLTKYKGVKNYMDLVVEKAKQDGYVTTMFDRRRYLPELSSSNHNLRAFGERVAMNMPIQGTAADIIKVAMIRVYKKLKEERLSAKLILQIHDELIVEAPNNEKDRVKEILTNEMQNAIKLRVPLLAEANAGKTWYDAKC